MNNALLKTLVLATAVAGIVSLTGCKEANSAPSGKATASEAAASSAEGQTSATTDTNARKAEAGNEIY